MTKNSFIVEELDTIIILPFFSPTHEITYIAGYLLTEDDEYSLHHELFGQCYNVENNKE